MDDAASSAVPAAELAKLRAELLSARALLKPLLDEKSHHADELDALHEQVCEG